MFAPSKPQGKLSVKRGQGPVSGHFYAEKHISPQTETIRIIFRVRWCLIYKNTSKFLGEKRKFDRYCHE